MVIFLLMRYLWSGFEPNFALNMISELQMPSYITNFTFQIFSSCTWRVLRITYWIVIEQNKLFISLRIIQCWVCCKYPILQTLRFKCLNPKREGCVTHCLVIKEQVTPYKFETVKVPFTMHLDPTSFLTQNTR